MREKLREGEAACSYESWMLNLRFILILLVCVASGIEPLVGRFSPLQSLYTWIFIFHMPLFAYVTGYFARNNLAGKQGNRILGIIALQYVIFQSLYSLADFYFFQAPGTRHSFFIPYLMLWFLVAHIGWRVIIRLMNAFNVKHKIGWALLLGVLAGFAGDDGSWLSFSRMLVFLPFFAAGYVLPPKKLTDIYHGRLRSLLGLLSVGLLAVTALLLWKDTPAWLYGRFTYAEMNAAGWSAALTRLAYYALQAIAGACFLALVPWRRFFMTDWGSRTLYVFLLHGLFIRSAIELHVYDSIDTWGAVLILFAGILLMLALLSQPRTRHLTQWLIEPDTRRLEWTCSRLYEAVKSVVFKKNHPISRNRSS